MKVLLLATILLLAGCGARSDSQFDIAASTGAFLAERLAEPLHRAATAGDSDPEHEIISSAVEFAVADVPLPDGVRRIASYSSASLQDAGYASLHIEFVVVPVGEDPPIASPLPPTAPDRWSPSRPTAIR